jgi:hypothetical protein
VTRLPRSGGRNDGALGDEQASLRGPLRVVLGQSGSRDAAGRPAPRHRRQHHPANARRRGESVRQSESDHGTEAMKNLEGQTEPVRQARGSPVGEAEAGRLVRREEQRAWPLLRAIHPGGGSGSGGNGEVEKRWWNRWGKVGVARSQI